MKVALCVPLDLNHYGGVEKHVLHLARALRNLGVRIDVFGNTSPDTERSPGEIFHSWRNLISRQYHIIHTHSSLYGPRCLAMQLMRLAPQRHIHTAHNVALDYLLGCRDWLNWRCYYATGVEAMWYNYADYNIVVSNSIKNWALKLFGVKENKITVIPNGFDPERIASSNRSSTRLRLGLSGEDLAVIFVGRGEDKVKGTKAITATMEKLSARCSNLKLLVLPGTGYPDKPWLIRTGPVPHEQVQDFYAAADIFVNASLSEGMPLTVIEAMAASLPVVAAPVGGITELITHNQTGLLLEQDRSDLTDQLDRLIENPDLRQRLGQNAQQAVAPLTWENLARQTIKVYEQLMEKHA